MGFLHFLISCCCHSKKTAEPELDTDTTILAPLEALLHFRQASDRERPCLPGRKEGRKTELDFAPLDALLQLPIGERNERLLSDLEFLREFLKDPPRKFVAGNPVLRGVESIFRQAFSIISGYDLNNIKPDEASELWTHLSRLNNLYENPRLWVQRVRRFVYDKNAKPSREYYPMADQLMYVDHLVEKLEHLVKHNPQSVDLLKPNIVELQIRLQSLTCWGNESEDFEDMTQRDTCLAYEVEYAIDSYLLRDTPIWFLTFWLDDILYGSPSKHQQSTLRLVTQEHADEDYIIPILEKLEDWPITFNGYEITNRYNRVIYPSPLLSVFFVRTWCSVSSYQYHERKKKIFLQLLDNAQTSFWSHPKYGQLYRHRAVDKIKVHEYLSYMTEDDLKREVYRLLAYKRYVVILEDVWDSDVLIDIVSVLPRNHGSRVLVITSSTHVATVCQNLNNIKRDEDQTSQVNKPTVVNGVVGFETETKRMLERLTGESHQLCLISIVGMAGQGKSTLAMKLYNDPLIVDYFDTRMWCYVSQVYEMRALLLELLGQVIQLPQTVHDKNDEQLAEMLYKHVKGRRFLVFLDDIWTVDAWNNLRRCFPDDNNGSRIMFTTRIEKLASKARSGSVVQHLCPLSHEESWELLKNKVFSQGCCPQELLGVGKKIAEYCNGLPLSIVLVAGFLEKMEKALDKWENIASNLNSRILGDTRPHGSNIMEMSYKNLPYHLRPCFLYFGALLGDREVLVSKLIRLWIAERFIRRTELKSFEDVAEDYLKELIGRSLVTVTQEKSNGGVKLCRVHNLLHEFCLTKAKEENFFQQINGKDEHFLSSRIHLRRLCIHSTRNQFVTLDASRTFVRSLLFFATSDLRSRSLYDISFICRDFKYVTIVDLEGIKIADSFRAILDLILLRYLAVQCSMESIPSSIANLRNLETFFFKGVGATVLKVPDSIWGMARLRHVDIDINASFDLVPGRLEMAFELGDLLTFSMPSLVYGDELEKMLSKSRSLQKLKCVFFDSWDHEGDCNQLPQLEFLKQLVSLRVCYKGEVKQPYKFNLPSNLRKLTLSNFHMSWKDIPQLAALCNLEVLKLEDNAFDGETWEMEDEVFPKLKFLKLDTLNVIEWSASGDHFPRLECLMIHKCEQLEEIPPYIGDIVTLKIIEVMWCNPSVSLSAKRILEEQQEFGNEELRIRVHPKVYGSELSL